MVENSDKISFPFDKYPSDEVQELLDNPLNPTAFTFLSKGNPITIPIWTYYYHDRFYFFASKNSNKVKAIGAGSDKVAINIIHKDYYPHPDKEVLSYLGVLGSASIIGYSENEEVAKIHIKLLTKYDPDFKYDWIKNLVDKLRSEPKTAWLIEMKPSKWFSY